VFLLLSLLKELLNIMIDESKIIGRFRFKDIPLYSLMKVKSQRKSVYKIDKWGYRDRTRQNWLMIEETFCYLLEN